MGGGGGGEGAVGRWGGGGGGHGGGSCDLFSANDTPSFLEALDKGSTI